MLLTNRIGRVITSDPRERKMLALTFTWLVFFRLRNLFLPYRLTRKWMAQEVATGPSTGTADESVVVDVTRSVRRCSRFVPGATCLVQALATRAVLRHYGQDSSIRLGVAKSARSIAAHAWVEIDGRIVLGMQPNSSRYTVLNPPSSI